MFDKVKKFYDMGLYTKAMVAKFVQKGAITAAQYEEITGEVYPG